MKCVLLIYEISPDKLVGNSSVTVFFVLLLNTGVQPEPYEKHISSTFVVFVTSGKHMLPVLEVEHYVNPSLRLSFE